MKMHFVTGATGLVGGAIVLELMRRSPDEQILCLVRGSTAAEAQDRLEASLTESSDLYGMGLSRDSIAKRSTAILGDIVAPNCGVRPEDLSQVKEVWHCAASLKFADADRAEIEAHNIGGTANLLGLAETLSAPRLNHVSTAYVVGDSCGTALEQPVDPRGVPNNVYEETKVRAEAMVSASSIDRVRILRPSIVIGHSDSRLCSSRTGMYGFIDQMVRFIREVEETLGDYLAHRSVSLIGRPETRINFVPIDVVARGAVDISGSNAPSGIYHLASLHPPTLGDCLGALTDVLGIREPRYVESEQQLSSIDAAFNRGADFHRAYLLQDKGFDCSISQQFVAHDLLAIELGPAELRDYVSSYLDLTGQSPGPARAERTAG
jgi:nucleoside-diphosphate-sugar epimerase